MFNVSDFFLAPAVITVRPDQQDFKWIRIVPASLLVPSMLCSVTVWFKIAQASVLICAVCWCDLVQAAGRWVGGGGWVLSPNSATVNQQNQPLAETRRLIVFRCRSFLASEPQRVTLLGSEVGFIHCCWLENAFVPRGLEVWDQAEVRGSQGGAI